MPTEARPNPSPTRVCLRGDLVHAACRLIDEEPCEDGTIVAVRYPGAAPETMISRVRFEAGPETGSLGGMRLPFDGRAAPQHEAAAGGWT